jgi:hypothetical protein
MGLVIGAAGGGAAVVLLIALFFCLRAGRADSSKPLMTRSVCSHHDYTMIST